MRFQSIVLLASLAFAGLPASAAELLIPLSGKEVAASIYQPSEIGGKGVNISGSEIKDCGVSNIPHQVCLAIDIGRGPPLSLTLVPKSGKLKVSGKLVGHDLLFWAPDMLSKGAKPAEGLIIPFGGNFLLFMNDGKTLAVVGH